MFFDVELEGAHRFVARARRDKDVCGGVSELDGHGCLTHVLQRIAQHPIDRIDDSMPWVVAPQLLSAGQPTPLAEAA